LTGNKGARSNLPCPFCRIPRQLLDKSYSELMKMCHRLPLRPRIEDLRYKNTKYHQYGGTYNMLEIYPKSITRSISNIVLPILHIQLGIMNKVIVVFDLIVKEWELRHEWTSDETSPAKFHLAKLLSKFGIERKKHYCGDIQGRSAQNLMKNMDMLRENFFFQNLGAFLPLIYSIPAVAGLKNGLSDLSSIYNGIDMDIGLRFLLNYQGTWTPYMVTELKYISQQFVSKLIKTIGRPPKDSRYYNSFPYKDMWRTSLASPKLHTLTAHVHEFVHDWNFLGKAKEESFEHTHKETRKLQTTFSANQCKGMQIIENMRQGWVKSSLHLKETLRKAEERRIAEGKRIKRTRYN